MDRLLIIISGVISSIDQLFAVLKLQSGTGEVIASIINETLELWGITVNVKCMSFVTTVFNTGLSRRACTLLEQKMNKEMFWWDFRHHILEIIL